MSKIYFDIRKATVFDASDIAEIGYECWKEDYKNILPESFLSSIVLEKQSSNIEHNIRNGHTIYVASNYNHETVGFISFGKAKDHRYPANNEIYSIYIKNQYRRMGLGEILLYEVENSFENRVPVLARIIKDNVCAVRFFEKNKYIYCPGKDGKFKNLVSDALYEKVLKR